jgi:hypothetical protein
MKSLATIVLILCAEVTGCSVDVTPHVDPYRFSRAVSKLQADMIISPDMPLPGDDFQGSRWGFEAWLVAGFNIYGNSASHWSLSDTIVKVDGDHPRGCPSPIEERP